jgi:hypothetical protein
VYISVNVSFLMRILVDSGVVASKLTKTVKRAKNYENEFKEKANYSVLKNAFKISLL